MPRPRSNIRLEPILGPDFNPNAIYYEIAKELERESQIWRRMFDRATATWTPSSKPRWNTRRVGFGRGVNFSRAGISRPIRTGMNSMSGGEMSITLESSSKPWIWVEAGTDRRYKGIVSSDWRPKTRPRVIGSGPGAGRLLAVQVGNWVPGITPRDVRFVIEERRRLQFARNMARRISVGVTNSLTGPGSRGARQRAWVDLSGSGTNIITGFTSDG